MNLFRSEEHARRWDRFDANFENTLRPVAFWAELFGGEMFRARGRPDFVSWLRSEAGKKAWQDLIAKLP